VLTQNKLRELAKEAEAAVCSLEELEKVLFKERREELYRSAHKIIQETRNLVAVLLLIAEYEEKEKGGDNEDSVE
jgi:uncharacterized protein YgfB (UPF0149 family)